jgi:hypothetical protein
MIGEPRTSFAWTRSSGAVPRETQPACREQYHPPKMPAAVPARPSAVCGPANCRSREARHQVSTVVRCHAKHVDTRRKPVLRRRHTVLVCRGAKQLPTPPTPVASPSVSLGSDRWVARQKAWLFFPVQVLSHRFGTLLSLPLLEATRHQRTTVGAAVVSPPRPRHPAGLLHQLFRAAFHSPGRGSARRLDAVRSPRLCGRRERW